MRRVAAAVLVLTAVLVLAAGPARADEKDERIAVLEAEVRTLRERRRMQDAAPWRRWGPYLAERQWGTVREDYSADGSAWDYFPHDHARSRAYRWGEDGLAGISDRYQYLCFALALWNGNDPILKERLFGLTGKSFIPLLSGAACAIPAIYAARADDMAAAISLRPQAAGTSSGLLGAIQIGLGALISRETAVSGMKTCFTTSARDRGTRSIRHSSSGIFGNF